MVLGELLDILKGTHVYQFDLPYYCHGEKLLDVRVLVLSGTWPGTEPRLWLSSSLGLVSVFVIHIVVS